MKLIGNLVLFGMLVLGSLFFAPKPDRKKPVFSQRHSRFRMLVLFENGGHHKAFTDAAIPWLEKLAADSGFRIDYLQNTDSINTVMLSRYQVFLQLDYVPYGWKPRAQDALIEYLNSGKGGWIGLHHASLLGSFDGFPIWLWYDAFMGGIHFKNYIPGFADGTVSLDSAPHPCFRNIPAKFRVKKEEWYTYDHVPEDPVKILAHVDEDSYQPASSVRMAYHPVIWTNPKMAARNIYIFMGHSPDLLQDEVYARLLTNAIFWAAGN
jgi:uncharacterized protein